MLRVVVFFFGSASPPLHPVSRLRQARAEPLRIRDRKGSFKYTTPHILRSVFPPHSSKRICLPCQDESLCQRFDLSEEGCRRFKPTGTSSHHQLHRKYLVSNMIYFRQQPMSLDREHGKAPALSKQTPTQAQVFHMTTSSSPTACSCCTQRRRSMSSHRQLRSSMRHSLHQKSCSLELLGSLYLPGLSVVAIHGLGGTARKTWTDPASGNFWLEDNLPDGFPKARIMTFGYDSGLAFSRSKAGVESFARDLLNRLRLLRSGFDVFQTPCTSAIRAVEEY